MMNNQTTVTDSLPVGLSALSPVTSPQGWSCGVINNGALVSCSTLNWFPVNQPITITFQATVTAPSGTVTNCATLSGNMDQNDGNNQSCIQISVISTTPTCSLAPIKSASPNQMQVGQTVTFSITVTNTGGPTCSAAPYPPVTTVDDVVPSGFSNPTGIGTGWTCITNGQDINCTMPGLNPPQSSTITITATAAAAGTYSNCADLSNIGSVPPTSQSCTQVIIASPPPAPYCDMEVTTALQPSSGPSDSVVTLTATVTNVGTKTCVRPYGLPVMDSFPAGMLGYPPFSFSGGAYLPLPNPRNWNCSQNYDGFGCSNYVSPMGPGQTNTISLQVTAWGTAGSTVTNCVDLPISASPTTWIDDVNPSNNHACASFTLTTSSGLCDRAVTETVQPASGASGQTVTFTVTGTNVGAHACPPGSTVWTPQSSAGMALVGGSLASSSPDWLCYLDTIPNLPYPPLINAWCEEKTPTSGGSFTYPLMQPGDTVTYSFQAVMSGAAGTSYSKCAGTSSFGDSDLSNNDACAAYTILFPGCDRAVTKTIQPASAPPGQTATITITVTNAGTGACPAESGIVNLAHITLLGDNLPPGMTTVPGSLSAPSAWYCGLNVGDLHCVDVPAMQPGDTATISFQIVVGMGLGTTATNCASITTLDDGNTSNNSDCANFSASGSGCAPPSAACRVIQTPNGLSLNVTEVGFLPGGQSGSYSLAVKGVVTNGGNQTEYVSLGIASGSPAISWRTPNLTLNLRQLGSSSTGAGPLQSDVMIEVVGKSTKDSISDAMNVSLPPLTLNPGTSSTIYVVIPVTVNAAGAQNGTELHVPLSFGVSLAEGQSSSAYRALQCFLSGSPENMVALCSSSYAATVSTPNTTTTITTTTSTSASSSAASSSTTAPSPNQSGPRCVIATAAYGSDMAAPVQFLRGFRDNHVQKTLIGSAFLTAFNNWYYSWAPSVAQAIAPSENYKAVTRVLITPLIGSLFVGNAVFSALAPLNPELAVVSTGLLASAIIGLIYLTPVYALTWKLSKRRITRRTICSLAIVAGVLAFIATLTTGTFSVSANLTALTVVETMLLTPAFALRKMVSYVGGR